MSSFTEKLDPAGMAFLNKLMQAKFSEQAVSFLNSYWAEVGSQAEFIFTCAMEVMRYADMHSKGNSLINL